MTHIAKSLVFWNLMDEAMMKVFSPIREKNPEAAVLLFQHFEVFSAQT